MTCPLEGVRILDLTDRIAGAYATKLLADAGADVIKIEPPEGDPLRRWSGSGQALPRGEDGPLFRFLNTSKRSVVADLAEPVGRTRLLEMAAQADAVVESFEPGRCEQLGLDLAGLQSVRPSISLVSVSAFGRGGPWSGRPASEFTLQALCGSTAARGEPERPPLAAGGRLGEWISGLFTAIATLMALRRGAARGVGEHVDVSMFEAMCTGLNFYEYLHASLSGDFEGYVREQFGRALEVPSIEEAADGYVGFALFTAQMWQEFAHLVERPELAEDASLGFMLERWPRRQELSAAFGPWLRRHTVDEIVRLASERRIPVAPIGNGRTIPAMAHFRARGTFVPNPSAGFAQPCVPYRLAAAATRPFSAVPRLGEHDGQIERPPEAEGTGVGAPTPGPPSLPLAGLRVADFSQFIAGPTVTHLLAALGAEVVKIEGVARPDGIRFASARAPEVERWWEYGWVFHGLNTGKRSLTLDLNDPDGLSLARELIRGSDWVVENFAPRVMESFGLGPEQVSRLNPRAIYLRMPAFGLTGPWRDRVGLAQTMEQLSGLAHLTGYADGPPVIPRGPCDAIAGLHAAFAALLALAHRDRGGAGGLVESVMVEGALNVAAEQLVEFAARGELLERNGNRDPVHAPQDLYACRGAEAWLALSITSDAQWAGLRELLGHPAWASDSDLATAAGRRLARDRIDAQLRPWFAQRELDACVEQLAARGVPAAAVVPSPLVTAHAQHAARGFLTPLQHPLAGAQQYPGLPWRSSAGAAWRIDTPPPLLGQHNAEILSTRLGQSPARMAELRARGVIGDKPAGF